MGLVNARRIHYRDDPREYGFNLITNIYGSLYAYSNHEVCVAGFSAAVYLVLLPVEVQNDELELSADFGTAIQSGLRSSYRVFFGRDVETELVKIYQKLEQKIDCDAGLCNREIAMAFNARLVADSSVRKIPGGYMARLHVRNVATGEIVHSRNLPCRGCDAFELIERLPGLGNEKERRSITASGAQVSDERAILVIDSFPSGANIYVNGKDAGKTPYQGLGHRQGQQVKIRLEKDYFLAKTFDVNLTQSITELPTVKLDKGMGKLLVLTKPYQKGVVVSLDGLEVGRAPYQALVEAGEHRVGIRTSGGYVEEIVKAIHSNKEAELSFNIKPAKQVSSPPPSALPTPEPLKNIRTFLIDGVEFNLVRIPAGRFKMGSLQGEDDEKPLRSVDIDTFYIMETEATFALWDACEDDGDCHKPDDEGWGRKQYPVVNVSWKDITSDFIPWLNRKTGASFRLPSESEWEYAARAGKGSEYPISIDCSNARYGYFSGECGDKNSTAPVKSFSPSAFGLYDMHGNVYEWVQDCWHSNYDGAPLGQQPWEMDDCEKRVTRGGSWRNSLANLRPANRHKGRISDRNSKNGFRLVLVH